MPYTSFRGEFIEQAEAYVLENFSNEQFGVSELADLMNMSRSNLLRKVKKQTDLSVSQFIRLIRLQKGMELLEQTELTISEISYQVGFGNNSYFIKCFREHYGYSPGEARKRVSEEGAVANPEDTESQAEVTYREANKGTGKEKDEEADKEKFQKSFFKQYRLPMIVTASLVVILGMFLFFRKASTTTQNVSLEKSIAILPFKNMSSDSANLYFVNGLMESSLNNLQKIKDLRVISRTSVEKYRNTNKTISEIAKELNVSYLVEGSGQRIGDQVLLNIQLIEAANDTPVWSKQYNYRLVDIFSLQNEVAKKIANAIKAKVTPAELEQIDKKPTNNLLAYDDYLKAMKLLQTETEEGLRAAIPLFEKAIKHDPQFSLAYAKIAMAYFYLDLNKTEKRYTDIINRNADKALLYDTKSAESLIAKALYYINNREFQQVIPHLEKALEYNPNSASVINLLSDMYARVTPNTAKYLKYALRGIELDIAANDSIGKSYIYLHLSNAFIQNGFVKEAVEYINLSLSHNPANQYAPHLKVFIDYAQHQNVNKATNLLVNEWKKDTTRLDVIQDVAKLYYFQEKYDSAFYYYQKFVKLKKKNNLDIYPYEDLKIGITFEKLGLTKQAADLFKAFSKHCQTDQSIYQPAGLASKYVHEGKFDQAIEQLKIFASKKHYQYWIVLFLDKDPLMKPLKNNPEFELIMKKIKQQFWEHKTQLKKSLGNYNLP